MELCARRGVSPIARSTCDGSSVPDEQAEPVETATPSRSSAISSASASTPGKLTFVVFGTRSPLPLTAASGTRSISPASRRSRRAPSRAASAASLPPANAAAAPRPTTAGTFSVPARRFRSCRPPVVGATKRIPRRTHSAPTPLGPLNLCAEIESRSTPRAATSIGILPADCTASVWNRAPRACATAASRAIGCTVPISLLACITETRAVRSPTAASRSAGSTTPARPAGSSVVVQPRFASAFSVLSTASCSMADATRCRRPAGRAASATPRTARLSASVPPPVKITSLGRAPSRPATAERASSRAALAAWPNAWMLEAFPKRSRTAASMASATRGSTGVVALWSRYSRIRTDPSTRAGRRQRTAARGGGAFSVYLPQPNQRSDLLFVLSGERR